MNIMNYAQRDVLHVAPGASMDEAIGLMESRALHHLVVVDGGRVVGMLSDRDILLSTGWMLSVERTYRDNDGPHVIGPTHVGQIMSRPAVTLTPASTAREAAVLMETRRIGALPILQGDRMIGIVTHHDLLAWLDELAVGESPAAALLSRAVRDRMRTNPMLVEPDAPLGDVVDVFRRFRVRHVPVVAEDKLVGIVSDRDVRRSLGWAVVRETIAEHRGRLFDGPERVADIMQTEVHTVGPDDPLRMALHRLREHRIHSLPVVEGRRVAGIITQTDFIRAVAEQELL